MTSDAPPKRNAVNSVSRIAYRASAKTDGLAASTSAATKPTSNDTSVVPSHAVIRMSASAASAGTSRAPNSVGPASVIAPAWSQWNSIGLSKNGCSL